MDVFERLEKLWISGLHHQIKELMEKHKHIIYPPDYHQWKSGQYGGGIGLTSKLAEEWRQSIGENDIIHSLYFKVRHDKDGIYEKVGNTIHSPPKNPELFRDEASKILLEKIELHDKIIDEANNFDISVFKEDGFLHFDWSKTIWKNALKVAQSDLQSIFHYLMLQPEKMILSAVRTVDLCTGELENSYYKAIMMNNLSIYYRVVNDIDKNRETRLSLSLWLENFIKIYGHAPKLPNGSLNMIVLATFSSLGELDMLEGNLIQAEKYLLNHFQYSQDGFGHIMLARFYTNFGEIEKAEKHLEMSLTIEVHGGVEVFEAQYYTQKARLSNIAGRSSNKDINTAIELIENHLKENDYVTSIPTIETYYRVADIYMANSDLDEARKYYSKVADMCKIVHYYDFHRAECLMKLIQISCIEGEDTELLKNELYGVIADYSNHEKMVLYKDLSEALIMKHMTGAQRGRSRFRSLEIFEKVSRGKIYDINLHIFARFNYCELLLDEFQFYGDKEILGILVKEVEDLATMAREKGLILYYIEVLILRSKIATLQKDLEFALEYLEEAQTLANERNLKIYQDRIKIEKETYLQNLDSWNSMGKDDKIDKLRLKQYLKFAQQNITK
ncbi:MAG: hypothetical protein GPJ54_12625 [Candidatus Heimdallarchaeota archaeon]|nr:hypothetical protein [Candidatus Heimdallarchaeota archaeon]